MAAPTTHSIERDSRAEPSTCARLSMISTVGVSFAFVLVAFVTRQWAWLVIPGATLFMAAVQGILMMMFPGLRRKTACGMKGCGDAR